MYTDELQQRFKSLPRWHRLPFRATAFVAVVVATSVCASVLLLARLIHIELARDLRDDTAVMANSLVALVGRQSAGVPGSSGEEFAGDDSKRPASFSDLGVQINALGAGGERLAFAVVEGPDGIPTDLTVGDADLWAWFVQHRASDARLSSQWLGHLTGLGYARSPEATMYRTGIPSGVEGSHLLLCVTNSSYAQLIRNVYGTAVGVALLACLMAMPVTIVGVGRLTRPIRRITRATLQLASGRHAGLLTTERRDEIGLLTHAFNEMSLRLYQARQELMAANERLEDDVRQRTGQLEEANRRLQQEIDTKNEFLRSVSHDLSAPLRNIGGMIAMIERRFKQNLPAEVIQRLDRITVNVQAQHRMLEDLLTLSRIRTRPGTPQRVPLGDLIRDVVATFEHDLAERNITCEVDGGWPTLLIEPNLVCQIVQNLIDNAIKYMGDAKPRRITITHAQTDPGWFELAVADTGPGIPAQEQDKVFKIFQRGSAAARHEIEGRGIGLPSVLAAAERWGGTVVLKSAPGQGSQFIVRIPADRIQKDEQEPADAFDIASAAGPLESNSGVKAPDTDTGYIEEIAVPATAPTTGATRAA